MAVKLVIVVLLVLVIVSLFQALFVMLKGGDGTTRMSKHLGRRLAFSVAVVALLLVLLATGVITPNARPY
ncbi:DUF2909 domain-containing protein [Thauera sp.]|jgi:hypothetical protein|uniref:DUF2909 domain-containing protein n=1 Tax=Thauera sp. TaxID=1905334 RepID=UPI002A369F7B|nr:DUF2909 domain-containing protein [Thauera sp.]MDX9886635.1 DUF2909 domain-containing protein [Thauera sp.]